jgi:hypothetical protein
VNLLQVPGATGRAFWVLGAPEARGVATRNIAARFERDFRLTYDLKVDSVSEVGQALMSGRGLPDPVVHIVRNAHLWEDSSDTLKKWFSVMKNDTIIMESGMKKWQPDDWRSKEAFKPKLRQYVQSKFSTINTEFAKTSAGRLKLRTFLEGYAGLDKWTAKRIADETKETVDALKYAQRLRNFPNTTDTLVESLSERKDTTEFVHSLLENRKKDALAAPYSRKIFGDLAFSIDLVALMSRNQRMGESSFALATRLGVHRMLVESHLPAVKFFDRSTMGRRLDCIAITSELWEQAENDEQRRAALVCLVALW